MAAVYVSAQVSKISCTKCSPAQCRSRALRCTLLSALSAWMMRPLLSAYNEKLLSHGYHQRPMLAVHLRGPNGLTLVGRSPTLIEGILWFSGPKRISSSPEVVLTLGRRRKVIPSPCYKVGVFDMLQYFESILPSEESLWSSLQNEVYFMGGGAAGGLWRHQSWSPSLKKHALSLKNGLTTCYLWPHIS